MSQRPLDIIVAGRVPYREALAWQRALAGDRIAGRRQRDVLLLLEHPPVITLGRGAHSAHVLRPADAEVVEVERGGDVTFHGPGQLVGYPILDLTGHRRDLHWYLRALEDTLIDALGRLDVLAERRPPHTGVWTRGRKLASIGVHVKQWVTWHGFALNVTTDLSAFAAIVPCGIAGVEMTSVWRERPAEARTEPGGLWHETITAVIAGFENTFGVAGVLAGSPPLASPLPIVAST
jgi:lipoate-protein ligase B